MSVAAWAAVGVLAAASMALLGPHESVAAVSQPGCLPPRAHAAGSTAETLSMADGARQYRLHVPPSYNGFDRMPLVLNFHGAGDTAASQEYYSGFSRRADASGGGFIVVYPQALVSFFNSWQSPLPEPDDVAFVDALLDSLESSLCIDTTRIYATGFSNGAMMSVRLACSLSDRIAAIGAVAGVYYPALSLDLDPGETCPDTRPVPIIAFHGADDGVVPFLGGPTGVPNLFVPTFRLPIDDTSPEQEDVLSDWAAHNACSMTRTESVVTDNVHLVSYDQCANGADVQLYAVLNGGHTWPGAVVAFPSTTYDISATNLTWDFFRAHSLDMSPQSDIDGDTVPDTLDLDDDGDGCADLRELQTAIGSELTGGRRDPTNRWDFYDTDGDMVTDLDDIFDVAFAFGLETGSQGDRPYDARLDRSRPAAGADSWDMQAPDGSIDLFADILGVAAQFGHNCQAAQ